MRSDLSTARNRGRARLPTASLLKTQDECHRHNSDRLQRLRFARQVRDTAPVQAGAHDVGRPPEGRQDFLRMDQAVCLKAIQQRTRAQATAHTMPQGLIVAAVDILRDVPFEALSSQDQLLCIPRISGLRGLLLARLAAALSPPSPATSLPLVGSRLPTACFPVVAFHGCAAPLAPKLAFRVSASCSSRG